MRNFSPVSVLVPLFLMAACTQQPPAAGGSLAAEPAVSDLQPRQSGLDEVAAAFAFDPSGAAVYVAPVQIDYTRRSPGPGISRAQDYELDQNDRQRLDELMAQTFSQQFLAPRNSRLAADPASADYTLQLRLEKFSIAGPLDPSSTWVRRTFTEQSAYAVLAGTLYDRNGQAVMRFRDRRDIGADYGGFATGNVERFDRVTFWADMKIDLRRAFSSLDKSLR